MTPTISLDGFAIERIDVTLVPSQTNDGRDLRIDLLARNDVRTVKYGKGLVEGQPIEIHETIKDVPQSTIDNQDELFAFVRKHVTDILVHEVDEWLAINGARQRTHEPKCKCGAVRKFLPEPGRWGHYHATCGHYLCA